MREAVEVFSACELDYSDELDTQAIEPTVPCKYRQLELF